MSIAVNIRRRRCELSMPVAELARRLGHADGSAIYAYESGRKKPGLFVLARIAAVLDTDIVTLTSIYDPGNEKGNHGTD